MCMNITKIKKQFARTESMLARADSQRVLLWDMLLPYMSEEFHDESCYIDVAHGDGLVVVFEEAFNFVRNYPVSQILDLIEEGVTCITPDQLTAI
nr:MAG TPA: hypothetical protein [Caudoviricetes sp.]